MRQPVLNDRIIRTLLDSGNIRELCALMLYEVYENGAYTNLVLKQADMAAKKGNAALKSLRAMLYGTVTYTYTIDFLVNHLAKRDLAGLDTMPGTLIRMGCWQILFSTGTPDFAAVSETVKIADKYCPQAKGLVNAILRRIAGASDEEKDPDNYRPDVACSLKNEIYGILKRDYGKDRALAIGKAFLKPTGLTVRFDPRKISSDEIINKLMEESFGVHKGAFLPEILSVEAGDGGIENSEAYKDGLFFVQNEAAALASHIASPKRGDRILDCCAAPGGKTTHMAELTGDEADITAVDSSPSRLKLLEENLARLGIGCVHTVTGDATDMSGIEGEFDIVLADCPCSGLGIIGRKPDIRLNMNYERIVSLADVQRKILAEAASKVRRGGALIYCTCTVNKDENERRVAEFLENNSDFAAVSIMPFLPPDIIMDEERGRDCRSGYITLLPDTDLCDGFFIARMERIG